MSSKHIHVAVGIIKNAEGKILIAKRAKHQHQGGLWEFPGGKVEEGESALEALVREFKEEVNITIHSAAPFMMIKHDYGNKKVMLDIWISNHFSGEAYGNENQLINWVLPEKLGHYQFPEANREIVKAL
ncbi:7,8-dihydro-8-oxoguanine-triphosphatase [Candidatus Endobugula sertula]|uniref:8-oxo-dGTP diphosphatase n=1 Tax=Candidatus Endobugula sertula TaxID=62101 RepID=A0A1D2QTK8_9GAMM|nr:7,8-dihydro-8-oxoguanine-triphosphatase [Candidatus Endobugula sertula]